MRGFAGRLDGRAVGVAAASVVMARSLAQGPGSMGEAGSASLAEANGQFAAHYPS